jgi:anhydro-N-acetylmuramic acid kinase
VTQLSKGRQTFDRDGRWAARGKVSEKLLAYCMAHRYIRKTPPKTTGREEFGELFVRQFLAHAKQLRLSDADIVTTATAFTAESIADAYNRFVFPKLKRSMLPKVQIILGGGGAKNSTLRKMLGERIRQRMGRIGPFELLAHEDFGISSSAKEPLAFAIIAHETLLGRPGSVSSVTGARRPVVLGKIVPA